MSIGGWRWSLAFLVGVSLGGWAQESPEAQARSLHGGDEIRLVIPFGRGGATDVLFRQIAGPVSERLGRRIVLENVSGAAATRGAQRVREAAPDGRTLLGSHQTLILSFLSGISAHEFQDFVPVALLMRTINIPTTHSQHLVQSAAGFAEHVKSQATQKGARSVRIGMIKGSTDHFFWLQFLKAVGVEPAAVQMVGYPDTVSQVAALLGHEIDFSMLNLPSAGEMYEKGMLRPLGVAADQRLVGLPEVPTLEEQGIAVINTTNRGLFAPLGTPREQLEPVVSALAVTLGDDALAERLEHEFGTRVDMRLFEDYAAYLSNRTQALKSLADELGFSR
ncbi:tripartite tricarboxylate transporter substrate binding protein [Halomonas sp. TRM85114]|uniref:Bug family tripartite tricarboxylate transporter substrate binding protein n=1 Tax=Halomonas jincaotanensis TaxID=2810616 RepID=UPI001BD4AC3F|nr:tripartite tricarboxylate transporter substrate binding protein [Halomonas jincaotanensis]MBS9403423.1 tripartite tricarboxylate transporter substrate binding protein [Halomonas jincaotanensis]